MAAIYAVRAALAMGLKGGEGGWQDKAGALPGVLSARGGSTRRAQQGIGRARNCFCPPAFARPKRAGAGRSL